MNNYYSISISKINDVCTVNNREGKVLIIDDRSWYGLSFCRSGRLIYTHKGKQHVSKPGVAVFLPKGGTYQLSCMETGEFPLINFQLEGTDLPATFLCIPIPDNCTWESDYEIMEQLAMKPEQKQFALKSLLYGMLDQLLSEMDRYYLPTVLYTSVKFLEDNVADAALSNTVIAAHAGISEVYLRQLFVRYFALTPRQYLLKKRIDIAHILLRNYNTPISKVAEKSGFSSIYHFSRAFRSAEGCSPSEWRSKHAIRLF